MSTYTPRQIAQVAYGAGFRGDALVNAVAVALAESGGRTTAVGVNSDRWRSRDRGLWQINSHWHPEVSDAAAFNPKSAAAHTFRISSGGRNWSPWSTWKNGSAAAQKGRARMAVAGLGTGGGATKGTNAQPADFPSPFPGDDGLPGFGDDMFNWLNNDSPDVPGPSDDILRWMLPGGSDENVTSPLAAARAAVTLALKTGAWVSDSHNWFRVALVIGGAGGVVLGLGMLARSGALGGTAQAAANLPKQALGAATTAGAAVATGGASVAAKTAATATKAAKTVTQ